VPDQAIRSESDLTLSALAQLATLRLKTTRALISLIDEKNQYVLVEVTQNSRLRWDWPYQGKEDLFFGRMSLDRSLGLCGTALDLLSPRGPSTPLIVNDVATDERFNDHPFVASHRSVRFYAAIPIRTKTGFSIGAMAVMDEEPREGLGDDEIEFMGDIGLAIMAHLEMTRAREGERRSEKMIKGLGVFMKGRTDLHDWWLELRNPKPGRQQDAGPEAESEAQSPPSPPPVTHPQLPKPVPPRFEIGFPFPTDRPMVSTPMEYASSPDAAAIPRSASQRSAKQKPVRPLPFPRGSSNKSSLSTVQQQQASTEVDGDQLATNASTIFLPDIQENLVSARLREMFLRAGHIIQESIEVDGVLFLDATISASSNRSGERVVYPTAF